MKFPGWRWAGLLALSVTCCTQSDVPQSSATPTITTPATTIDATEDPTTTTARWTGTSKPTTLPTLDPATQDLEVTSAVVDLRPDVLEATEGMVLGIDREFLFEDGSLGGGPLVIRVEGGTARLVRGRWCGTDWGPAPLDDLGEGAVVAPYEMGYEVVRCAPGSEVQTLSHDAVPTYTAVIDGNPMLALISWSGSGSASSVDLMNLDNGDLTTLVDFENSVGRPLAASRSQDGTWVVTLAQEENGLDTSVRYVFVHDDGRPVDTLGNPQPEYPGEDSGLGAAAMTPDGRLLTLQHGQDSVTDLIVWDLETGQELSRFRVVGEYPDDPQTPWREGRFAQSVDTDGSRAVVNITAIAEEPHPFGIVIVDLATGTITDIAGEYENMLVKLGTFIHR